MATQGTNGNVESVYDSMTYEERFIAIHIVERMTITLDAQTLFPNNEKVKAEFEMWRENVLREIATAKEEYLSMVRIRAQNNMGRHFAVAQEEKPDETIQWDDSDTDRDSEIDEFNNENDGIEDLSSDEEEMNDKY